MDRSVNHSRLPNETFAEYRERIKVENDRYKTTVNYWLFDIKHKLSALKGWGMSTDIQKRVHNALKELEGLTCRDFGENENGELINK